MSEITIRKVENGYIINEVSDQLNVDDLCYVASTDKDMLNHVTTFFFGDHAEWDWVTPPSDDFEQPQTPTPSEGEDSTETIVVSGEPWPGSDPEAVADPEDDYPQSPPKSIQRTGGFSLGSWEFASSANGTTHPEQQD